jgi:hypothetical protein
LRKKLHGKGGLSGTRITVDQIHALGDETAPQYFIQAGNTAFAAH